ncbi:bacteriophage DNA transposition protein A, putative [Campylobacter jejuni subsp. doylei]|uniref:Bacteriophage DNA transposition protein A, putative n=1 Tax=Campylobacter jejuni subsp. doylei TaxID=32021 RepID=A0A3S4S4P5_CAMJU|nr:bacteriophage DNA transposition protein A, putative [Campylobacter jejuni subsp. doylei]
MWISSKEFAEKYNLNRDTIIKSTNRAHKKGKKFCLLKFNILYFKYSKGVGGHAGKTLQIWSKPLSKEEAKLIEQGFNIEDISHNLSNYKQTFNKAYSAKHAYKDEFWDKTTQELLSKALNDDVLLKNSKALQVQNTNKTLTKPSENVESNKSTKEFNAQENLLINDTNNLSLFAKASSKKQNLALQKAAVVKEWLHAKGKINTNDFINYINAKKIYEFKLTQNKLFAWQKEYLANGLDALIDKRENKKDDAISALGIKELFINTLLAQKGRLNASNIHHIINYELAKNGKLDLKDFLGKKDEF